MSADSPLGTLTRLKEAGRRLWGSGREEPQKKLARMRNDRRAGNRIPLRLPIRVKVGDEEAREALVLDVNLPGLAFEPATKIRIGETHHDRLRRLSGRGASLRAGGSCAQDSHG